MADEIRKIANLRTEASAPDLPGRVQNEEFVFDEMIGAELVQEVCRHKDIRSVEKLFSLADPIMISGAGDSQKALWRRKETVLPSSSCRLKRMYFDGKWICGSLRLIYVCTIFPWWKKQDSTLLFQEQNGFVTA